MSEPLLTVAFADDEPGIIQVLQLACQSQYQIVGTAKNGLEAIQLVQSAKPNILVLDNHMPVLAGVAALKQIAALKTTAVVILTADPDPKLARLAMDDGACGYILKPFEYGQIIPGFETAWHHFQQMQNLAHELAEMSENLATRKLLEKAKGILIEQQNFTEEMAHKTLQKMSQDQGISLKEICRSLIQVKLVLGKASQRNRAA
jgi:AmiR/NasT family two-component response regulator